MSRRITWQNVDAPDFRASIAAQGQAADLFDRAARTISGTLTGINDQNIVDENLAAIGKASQVQDISEFDRIMKQSGIAGFGIGEGRANDSLLNFVNGQRDVLESNRQTEQNFIEDQFRLNRSRVNASRSDAQFARSEENRLRGEKAEDLAFQISNNNTILNDDEARKRAEELAGGDRKLEDAIRQALKGRSEDINRVDPNVALDPQTSNQIRDMRDTLSAREQEVNLSFGANEDARILSQSIGEFETFDSPLDGILDSMNNAIDTVDGEEKQKRFNESSGSITNNYNTLKEEFSDLPPEIVASVMKDTFTDDGWFLTGDQLKTAMGKARQRLEVFNDPARRNGLRTQENAVRRSRDQFKSQRQEIDRLETRLSKALSRGNNEEALRVQQQLTALAESMGPGNQGPTSAEILDRVNQTLGAVNAGESQNTVVSPNLSNAENINQSAAPFIDGAQSFINNVGQANDLVLGNAASILPFVGGGATNLLGQAVSAFDADRGAALLDNADRAFQTSSRLRNEGFVPGNADFSGLLESFRGNGNSNSNQPTNTPTNPVAQNEAPSLSDIEQIITSGSLPPEVNIQAEVILGALRSGRAPGNGQPLNAASREMLEQRLLQLIQSVR